MISVDAQWNHGGDLQISVSVSTHTLILREPVLVVALASALAVGALRQRRQSTRSIVILFGCMALFAITVRGVQRSYVPSSSQSIQSRSRKFWEHNGFKCHGLEAWPEGNPSADDCMQACTHDRQCDTWTWKPGLSQQHMGNGGCWAGRCGSGWILSPSSQGGTCEVERARLSGPAINISTQGGILVDRPHMRIQLDRTPFMLCFFTYDNAGYSDLAKAAIWSAILKPTIYPVVFLSPEAEESLHRDGALNWLLHLNMTGDILVLSHEFTFASSMANFGQKATSCWGRLDVPFLASQLFQRHGAVLEMRALHSKLEHCEFVGNIRPVHMAVHQDHILYTDTDVIFLRDLNIYTTAANWVQQVSTIAIGPESVRGELENSGVMVINVQWYLSTWNDFLQYADSIEWRSVACEQGLILDFYVYQTQAAVLLPDGWNWKPYWGRNDDAEILHLHGPKPGHCLEEYAAWYAYDPFRQPNSTVCPELAHAYQWLTVLAEKGRSSGFPWALETFRNALRQALN